ncbi:MAG: NlpC/P60 family protein [Clostridiaceae bacterium]|nr:NlpC/P60 family protein [Clostridiaceae bacterium]
MAFFARIRKALFLTFIISSLTLTANAYDVKGGEVQVGSSVNMRASSSTGADIVSKLTNGERVAVLSEENGFYKVAYGGQSGYISSEYVELSDVMNVEPGSAKIITDVLNVRSAPSTSSDIVTRLSKGSTVKIIGINSGWFKIQSSSYTGYIHPDYVEVVANSISGSTASSGTASSSQSSVSSRQQIIDYASTLLGTPYVYGGASPKGFDCSGFTKYVYSHFNISLPHSSSSQYKSSVTKISRSELQVGDLVFFSSGGSGVGHVGIYVGGGSFIHAPSAGKSVCYDSLDSSYYSSHYIGSGSIF